MKLLCHLAGLVAVSMVNPPTRTAAPQTMKLLCLLAGLVAMSMVNANFLGYLKELESHSSFQQLSTDQKLLFAELVMATETNKLQDFVDRVGYLAIVQLLDDMAYADSHKFMAYLSDALGYHDHAPGSNSVLHKRDNGNHFGNSGVHHHLDHHQEHYSNKLTDEDMKVWNGLRDAAANDKLTAYIDSVGLGAVLGLMEKMDPTHANELFALIEKQLEFEAAMAAQTVVRRDSGSDDSVDDDDDDNRMSKANSRVLSGLRQAAKTDGVKSFIDQVGFGNVLGMIEQLDKDNAQDIFNLLEQQLELEGIMAAQTVVRRDSGSDDSDDDDDDDDDNNRMSKANSRVLSGLRQAAKTDGVKSFIDQVGFGNVLGMIEQLDKDNAQDIFNLLEQQLELEGIMAAQTVVRRDSGSDDSDDDDDDDDDNNRMSKANSRVLSGLRQAAKTDGVTSFIDQVGFGNVLGMIEQLDKDSAQDIFNLLEQQLQKEA